MVESPETLIVVLALGAIIGMAIERFRSKLRRQAWREKNNWRSRSNRSHWQRDMQPQPPVPASPAPKSVDAADQLRIVIGADFEHQAILNKSEARVFKELDLMVIGRNPGWQVMAQVSLGEILSCDDPNAYSCVNSKRVDLLLMDEDCQPRHAIEYQGGAHHQGTAAARDAVKKEALRRAGIGYHEVIGGQTTPSELKRLVERLVPSTDQPQDIIAQLSGQGG